MMNMKDAATETAPSQSGIASVPTVLVTLLALFFGVDYVANGTMENDGYTQVLILPMVAAFAAALGRIGAFASFGQLSQYRSAIVVFGFVAAAAIISIAYNLFESVGRVGALTFALVGISNYIQIRSNRREEANILLALVIGFHLAVSHAANSALDSSDWAGSAPDLIDTGRAAIASVFFAFWATSIVVGVITTTLTRGRLESAGIGALGAPLSSTNKVLMYALMAILIVQAIPLIWLGQISGLQEFADHKYLGSVWALFTTAVILFVAFCHCERWNMVGALVAVNWLLYTAGHLQEIGNEFPTFLSSGDSMSTFSWFFIGFWLNVAAIMLASRGYFGDVSPRHEPSNARLWWAKNSYPVMVALAIFVAFAVRTGWNVLPAMNGSATGLWDMTGGSDPWYMKRVVDYIVAERSHYIFDHDRAYPMGAINPRPPLFSWSLALGGLGLSWLLEMPVDEATWWSVAAMPAVFGALIVLPLAAIAKNVHSKGAGILTAWLIALMPGHISHATFGLADHDSFALLFLSMAFYYWVRAIDDLGTERMFENPNSSPLYLLAGIRETWHRNPKSMAFATLSGISFATVALGWKGFVYGPGILFIAYSGQIVLNMFRKRDSLPLTSATLQMLLTAFFIPLPFYIWPGLNLVFDPSGFQPMFYIIGFTLALGWVASSFRDRPWLLVLGTGGLLIGGILAILYILQELDYYNGWDILFTGGFYFSKNKIFGTIGEAQAPSRGVLFASYGPVVALIAVGCAFVLMWRGARRERQSHLLLGLWVIIATYMAWSAGRFIFNATPAMAVVGGIGLMMLWDGANFTSFVKEWRRSGIGTPRTRFRSTWPATKRNPAIPTILIVLMMVASQHATYGIDSGIPRGESSATDVDQTIHDIAPDFLRAELLGLSVLKSEGYNPESEMWYMGTFGPGFNSGSWNLAYDWLSEQDTEVSFSERPAFVSWWDYGFQALAQGQHPTVADNFQSGIPHSGGMLLSNSQEDTLTLFITTVAQGDRRYNNGAGFTESFEAKLLEHMSQTQLDEYDNILSIDVNDESFVKNRAMAVVATDDHTELLRGYSLNSEGLPEPDEKWVVLIGGTQMGNSTDNETEALELFNATRLNNAKFEMSTSHYLIGDYMYTSDLIDDFNDVSTGLHRTNAKLALSRAFLSTAFDMEDLAAIYHDITELEYEVPDYEGTLGETVVRNHDIRYFAIDNRLYPLGGAYYGDYQYHRGQTTGIFHAPTGLSGLDMEDYITSIYETQRGDGPIIPRTAAEYEEEYLNDIIRQTSGASDSNEVIQMVDIDYQHQPAFFETMVARFYVGYSTSMLGLPGDAEQPAPHFYMSGTPGSYIENAYPLPGAMMNHFVLANWYDDERCELLENGSKADEDCNNPTIGSANTQVKIMKYYSGATLEGHVELEGIGPIPNARVMFERDAFSGEEVADENGHVSDADDRTYWIPIGYADADENGHFSYTVPAGKIRVSAFIGDPDLDAARSSIMMGDVGQSLSDIFQETSGNRVVNPITGILANVSGATWLSETIVNVSGEAGHSNGQHTVYGNLSVEPSHATGMLVWSGAEFFDQDPLVGVTVEISASSENVQIPPYSATTSSGVVEGYDLTFGGIGQVTFTGEGSLISQGVVTVTDFTGNHSQTISHNHSLSGEGLFSGRGTLSGNISEDITIPDCEVNSTMPENNSVCSLDAGLFLIDGDINATGRFTSNGSTKFTRTLSHATFVGSGIFEVDATEDFDSYGTINGTFATVSGEGIFSGPMVQPGTFHFVDAIPGQYDIAIIFSDNTRVELDEQFTIPLIGNPDVTTVQVSGGSISGNLVDASGQFVNNTVFLLDEGSGPLDATIECAVSALAPCFIHTDEYGFFEFGPIVPGNYTAEIDLDSDGFPEISQDYEFKSDTHQEVTFPSPVPETSDLTFTLVHDGTSLHDLDVTLRLKNGTGDPARVEFDNSSGNYKAELTHGVWILNHTLSEELQLWEQITVEDEDIVEEYEFRVSRLVSGVVYYNENTDSDGPDEGKVLDFVEVQFHWGEFNTIANTDGGGEFSVVLPEGATVDATVQLAGAMLNLVNGTRFTVTSQGPSINGITHDNLTLIAVPGHLVEGIVSINRASNLLRSSYGGWQPIQVTADDSQTQVRWHTDVTMDGKFEMVLPSGNWTFDIDADWIESEPSQVLVDGEDDFVDIITMPENSTISIELFLDYSGDNNASNGTAVTYPFNIVDAFNSSKIVYEVSEQGDEWIDTGLAQISLEPGSYRIDVATSDPLEDLHGARIMTGETRFDVGLLGTPIEASLGFDPEWRVNITFTNESGGALLDYQVKMISLDTGWIQTFNTGDNGVLNTFISEGEWIATIDLFESSSGTFEILRELVVVSAESSSEDIDLSSTEASLVSFEITDAFDGNEVSGLILKLTSQDGLGEIVLEETNPWGRVEINLPPGNWNYEANSTENSGYRWIINSTEVKPGGVLAGEEIGVEFSVPRLVRLSGSTYWDYNDNDENDILEGMSDVNLSFINVDGRQEITHSTKSNYDGSWEIFLEAGEIWEITANASGFINRTLETDLINNPDSIDIELNADLVLVHGSVSYINEDQLSQISENLLLELIPTKGYNRSIITPTLNYSNGSWDGTWSAYVKPGSWLIRGTVSDLGLIDIKLIDASVVVGGNADIDLTVGGLLNLETQWFDFWGNSHSLADIDIEGADINGSTSLTINIGAAMTWETPVSGDGGFQLLMPAGMIEVSSEFDVSQANRNMTYQGERGVQIIAGQISPITKLSLNRLSNHEIVITTVNSSAGLDLNGGDAGYDVYTEQNDTGGFESVEFVLDAQYLGHESIGTYSMSYDVPGTDGQDWVVEFNNGSGNWNSSSEFDLGLDGMENVQLYVRVTPPNQTVAHSFEMGHWINLRISTTDGYSYDHTVIVRIPRLYSFELSEPIKEIYGFEPGQTDSLQIHFTNTGNGDEKFRFEFDDSYIPENWSVPSNTTHTLGPFVSTTHSIPFTVPADAGEEDFTIFINVSSDFGGQDYPVIPVNIVTSLPSLSITGHQLASGGEPVSGTVVDYFVSVSNDGYVDASEVWINGSICQDLNCENPLNISGSDFGEVAANSENTFDVIMDLDGVSVGTYYLKLNLESESGTVQEYGAVQIKVRSPPVEDTTDWIGWILFALLIFALLTLTRRGGRRKGAAPF